MTRTRYITLRAVQTIFLIWAVFTFLFLLFRFMPGSYLDILAYQGAGEETIQGIKEKWGLDDPLYVQYFRYIYNFLTLDVGTSFQYQIPVIEYVRQRIFNSFILVAPAVTFAYILGSAIGAIAGSNRGSWFDKHGTLPFIFAGTFPEFFTSILLVIIFAGWLNIFPASGMLPIGFRTAEMTWWESYLSTEFLWHYILPFTAVVLRFVFSPLLVMRTSVVEVLGQPFFQFQRISGVPRIQRLFNIAKHASLPVITLYPVSMTRSIGGLVLVEAVFNWPGIGFALVDAVFQRDYPVLQFVFMLIAIYIVIANFVVDIVYGIIDPRVSIEDSED